MSRKKAPELRDGHANRGAKPIPIPGESVIDPDPPSHLGEVGRRIWAQVWDWGVGTYSITDMHSIERYAQIQERRLEHLEHLAEDGYTTTGAQGQLVPHPEAAQLKDLETKLVALEDRLFLSPDARVRAGAFQGVSEDELDKFLRPE